MAKDFEQLNLSYIKTIQSELKLGQHECSSLDAIMVAVDKIIKHTSGKKYNRKIFFITDGACEDDDETMSAISKEMKENDIVFTIIGIDWVTGSPLEKLVELCNGNVVPGNEALNILSHFRSKTVRQTTTFRGNLTIGGSTYYINLI
jgi:uncharacterized protein YegL